MRKQVVIWGAGGHARVVADILRVRQEFGIAGFLDDVDPGRAGQDFGGAKILGGREALPGLRDRGVTHVVVAIGDCDARLRSAAWAREIGFELATAVHPGAIVAADVQVGEGTVLAAGAVVNPGAVLGASVIVNTAASVDHDCVVEDGVHICPGVHLAGGVRVGRASWVGIGTAVIDKVRIGARVLVGAGALVLSDLPDEVVAYGFPARVIRERKER
jgi:UDP-N-acetylbacillosamine N-acetyltransferase